MFGLLDHYGQDDAVFVGHDWGSMVVWEAARRGETIIPGSGHWVQQETPASFNDALLGFLGTL